MPEQRNEQLRQYPMPGGFELRKSVLGAAGWYINTAIMPPAETTAAPALATVAVAPVEYIAPPVIESSARAAETAATPSLTTVTDAPDEFVASPVSSSSSAAAEDRAVLRAEIAEIAATAENSVPTL